MEQQSQHVLIVKVYTRHDDSSTNVLLFDENENNINDDDDIDIDVDGGSILLDKKMKSINNNNKKNNQRHCRNNDKTIVQLPLLIGENWLQWYEHTNFLNYSQLSLDDTSTAAGAATASNTAPGNIILLPTILSLSEDISDMVHLPPTHEEINNSRPNTSQNSNSSSSLSVLYNSTNNNHNNANTNNHHIQRLPSPVPLGGRRQCCYLCFDVMIDDTVTNNNNDNNNENQIVSIKDMRDPIVSDSMILSSTPIWKHRNWTIHIQRHNNNHNNKTNNTNENLRRRISYRLHHGDSIIFRQSNNNMNNNNTNSNNNNNYNNNNHNIAMVVQYRNLNNIRCYQANNNNQKKKISVLLEDELILPDSYEDSQIKDDNNNTTTIINDTTNIQVQQQQQQELTNVNNLKTESDGLESRNENHDDNNNINNNSSRIQNEIATATNHESLLLSQLTSQDDDDDDDDNVDNDNDNVEGSYDISQEQQDHQNLQIQQQHQPTTIENEIVPNTSDNFYTSAATNDMILLTQPTTIDTTTTIIREDNIFSTTTKSLLAVNDHDKDIEDNDNNMVNEEKVDEDDDDDDTTIDPRRTIKDTKSTPNKQAKTSLLSNHDKFIDKTLQQQGTDTRKMPPPMLTTTITKSIQPASTISTMNVPTTDTSNCNRNDISPICSPNLLADTPRTMDRDGNEINSSIKQNDTMNQYDVLNEQVSSTIVDTPQHQHQKLLKSDDVQDDANNENHSSNNIKNSKNESSQDQQCIVDNPTTDTSIVPTQLHFDNTNDVVVEINDIAGNENHQYVKDVPHDETKPELSTNCNANNHSVEQDSKMVQSIEPDGMENNNLQLEPIIETDVITIPTNTNDDLANNGNNDNNSIELKESKQLSVPATENNPTTTSERTTRKRKNQSILLNDEEELSKSSFVSPRNVRPRRQQQQKQCPSSDVSLNTTSVSSTSRRRHSLTSKTTATTTVATPIGNNNSDHRSVSITSYAIRILVTGFDLNEKQKQMINKIPDAILIENISDAHYVTHIVVTDGIADIRRTCKLMIGICRTNNILIFDWIIDSSKQHKVLDVSKYRIQSNASYCHAIEQQYQFSIRTTVKNIQNRDNNNLLFHGWYIYLCPKVAGNKAPNTMEFQYIIEASGGIYLSSLKNINHNDNNNNNEASSRTTATTPTSTNTKKILIITSDPITKVQDKHIQQQTQKHCMNNNNTTSTAAMNVSIEHRTTTWFFYTIMIQQIHL